MAHDTNDPGRTRGGRSGNDYLQRGGGGHQSWGAEGPRGSAAGATMNTGARASAVAADQVSVAASPPATHAAHVARSGTRMGTLLFGIGVGAALMYFLDPARGTRRRHVVADKLRSTARDVQGTARDLTLDARNRAMGTVAEVRGRLTEEQVSDEQLVARVRAELGHHVERVRPIEVAAEGGAVTLRGTVTDVELPKVLATVEGVRGVERVVNELTAEGGTEGAELKGRN